ncbi:FAD-dependent oxidoreductase [Amycolatopsis sp. CA-230715]|uniref:FAD-dependent oxidoreductase n=1 Tax=Amycolatopsis sp. CA-230715 TaxID=2745196 RepID=UPI001C02D6F9|nr:NAD(P)/FAD-dependent oxidoreductase [Amycolatopsis sp. CA-230715]QWF83423.1 5-methylphenazine-1-carboxylate 1-monooxygenase [Amycolatopsis sp. CA-230715]
MNSARSPRIAIVGAGVGGLACARGLQLHGLSVTVFERETSSTARWQGGMLDLHVPTGQAAMRAAGLFPEFLALARPEAQELRALDPVTAAVLHHEAPADDERSAPEIDRGQLRGLLLGSLEPGTVHWGQSIRSATSLDDCTARLRFGDGTAEEFDLVVGADGAWSRVRPALSGAVPAHLGTTMVETWIDDVDTGHPALARLVGEGTLVAKVGSTMLSAQRNSGGHLRVYAALDVPPDWHEAAGVDLADASAVRAYLLAQFEGWHESLLDLLRHDGEFVNRPLYVLPVGHRWDHVPGITLVGDAAHLMPPFGIGANLALVDGTDLATAVATHASLDEAVRAYESVMLPRATAGARACAELAEIMTAEPVLDVDAARQRLNEQLLSPERTVGQR